MPTVTKSGGSCFPKKMFPKGVYIYPLLGDMGNMLFAEHSPRGNPMFPVFPDMPKVGNIEN